MIGSFVSHYRILERLGASGMEEVYKAKNTLLKLTVALKFLQPLILPEGGLIYQLSPIHGYWII